MIESRERPRGDLASICIIRYSAGAIADLIRHYLWSRLARTLREVPYLLPERAGILHSGSLVESTEFC
jgi:hypothetical protein